MTTFVVERSHIDARGNLQVKIPGGTTEIKLGSGEDYLKYLPKDFPESLIVLDLHGCKNFLSLPTLPQSLEKLNLHGCKNLRSLPITLPQSLDKINLNGCENLQSLPIILPENLRELDLSGCKNLLSSPKLIQRLQKLEEKGCEVNYPNHFSLSEEAALAKEKLSNFIAQYKTETESRESFFMITEIFHRFLSEGIAQRSSAPSMEEKISELLTALNPILDLIEKNPSHLVWMEKISSNFVASSVNKPVAAISEICALVEIANAKDENKLESAKHLLAFDLIQNFVENSNPKPLPSDQAQARNALLHKVHKKLFEEGKINKEWLGIPSGIAYESRTSSWLNQKDLIENAYNLVNKESLEKPISEIANYLLEKNHSGAWFHISFPRPINQEKDGEIAKTMRRRLTDQLIEESKIFVIDDKPSKSPKSSSASSLRLAPEMEVGKT